jgi:hypothetical protein
MNTPQRFLILWAMGVILSMLIVQSSFKTFPKLYHAAATFFMNHDLEKIETGLSLVQWSEKYASLIQRQMRNQQQITLQLQGSFSDLTQSLKDLPAGQLLSADLHKTISGLVLDLTIKQP